MRAGNTVLNQLVSNEIDGALGNIYLRFLESDALRYYPLIAGDFAIGASQGSGLARLSRSSTSYA